MWSCQTDKRKNNPKEFAQDGRLIFWAQEKESRAQIKSFLIRNIRCLGWRTEERSCLVPDCWSSRTATKHPSGWQTGCYSTPPTSLQAVACSPANRSPAIPPRFPATGQKAATEVRPGLTLWGESSHISKFSSWEYTKEGPDLSTENYPSCLLHKLICCICIR